MNLRKCVLPTVLLAGMTVSGSLLIGCSRSSDSTGAPPSITAPSVTQNFLEATTAVEQMNGIIPNTAPARSVAPSSIGIMTGISNPNDVWNSNFMPDARCSGGASDPHCVDAVSLKHMMGFYLNVDAVRDNGSTISVFGRLRDGMTHACAASTLLAYTNGGAMPTSGTHTITFTAETNTLLKDFCSFDSGELPTPGTTATAILTPTLDTTNYDSKVEITLAGEDPSSFFIRSNSLTLNLGVGEGDAAVSSRIWIALNRTTGVVRAEYASYSASNDSGEMHRLYFDPATKKAAILGSSYGLAGTGNQFVFTLVGKPDTPTGELAYSIGIFGFGLDTVDSGASPSTLNHYKGCLASDDGSVATDNTLACAGGISGADTSGALGALFTTYTGRFSGDASVLIDTSILNESSSVPFTSATDIFTAAVPIKP